MAKEKPWIAFHEQTLGIVTTLQPAIMALFLPYSNEKGWIKFEKFVLSGMNFDNAEYLRKVSSGARNKIDHLEECAHQIVEVIEESVLHLGEEQLAAAERASELHYNNEAAEFVMGLWANPAAANNVQQEAGGDSLFL